MRNETSQSSYNDGVIAQISSFTKDKENFLIYIIIIISLLCIYSPIIQNDFLYYDDYCFFTLDRAPNLTKISLMQARPIQGMIVDILNTTSLRFTGLKRITGLIGLSFVSMLLFCWLKRNHVQPLNALILSLAVCCLPSFLNICSYLCLTSATYSSFFSGLSAYIYLTTFENNNITLRKRVFTVLASIFLLFVSLSCYQLNAMFCWIIIAIAVILNDDNNDVKLLKNISYYFAVFCAALILYNLFYKIIISVYFPEMSQSGRSSVIGISEVIGKLKWFFGVIVRYAYTDLTSSISDKYYIQQKLAIVFQLVSAAIFIPDLMSRKQPSRFVRFIIKVFLVSILLPLCYLPFLILKENGGMIVYLSTLETMLFLLFCCGAIKIINMSTQEKRSMLVTIALLLTFVVSAYSANNRLMTKYALPNTLDYRYVRGIISQKCADIDKLKEIHVIGHLNFSEVLTYSEKLICVALHDCGCKNKSIKISSSSNSIPPIIHPEIYNRNKFYANYYIYNPTWGYYNLRTDLTPEERARLLGSITLLAKSMSKQEGALVIDLTNLVYMY